MVSLLVDTADKEGSHNIGKEACEEKASHGHHRRRKSEDLGDKLVKERNLRKNKANQRRKIMREAKISEAREMHQDKKSDNERIVNKSQEEIKNKEVDKENISLKSQEETDSEKKPLDIMKIKLALYLESKKKKTEADKKVNKKPVFRPGGVYVDKRPISLKPSIGNEILRKTSPNSSSLKNRGTIHHPKISSVGTINKASPSRSLIKTRTSVLNKNVGKIYKLR